MASGFETSGISLSLHFSVPLWQIRMEISVSEIILPSSTSLAVPSPKEPITVRLATLEDIPFVDALQKQYRKNLAFLPRKALEGKIAQQQVLVAEGSRAWGLGSSENTVSNHQTLDPKPQSLGYLIGQDKYFKRDELGIIFHLAVEESKQRGFIGAALLRAQFDRSAYGCRLYCCWCAQDLAANYFYESMGFVPIAFRAGSEKRGKNGGARVHIFWQKRIRERDVTTPWWFPSETKGGLLQADRLVFPIPPGVHWRDRCRLFCRSIKLMAQRLR